MSVLRVRVKLPKIGMTMEEATVVRFCRQPGEAFSKGDPLYEIETEKISQEVTATDDGVMVEHAVPEGSDVRVGDGGVRGRDRRQAGDDRGAAAAARGAVPHRLGRAGLRSSAGGTAYAPRRGPVPEHGGGDVFDQVLVHGKPVPVSLKIAFGALGGVVVELLQPLDDRSPHAAFLAERGEGMHHLAFVVTDFDEQLAAARRDNPERALLIDGTGPGNPFPGSTSTGSNAREAVIELWKRTPQSQARYSAVRELVRR